jgi:hypothetical protein
MGEPQDGRGEPLLEIIPEDVEAVLLADGWHPVNENSFMITKSCIFQIEKGTAQKRPEWDNWVASWKENPAGREFTRNVTVPFDSILGVRSK